MSESSTQTLGKYRIVRQLGRGAMGVVYEGFDPSIERRVALKAVRRELLRGDEGEALQTRFQREAQAAGRLQHANVVSVFDYGEADGEAYIAMEFVEGESLETHLKRGERFSLEASVAIMRGLLAGLAYAHGRGVVHRDIKPANVMLTADPTAHVKIADFGIARVGESTLTEAGSVMGTPGYMAPEQCLGEPADQRADIFAAGVMFYELLTGERPFTGSFTAILHKITSSDAVPASRLSTLATPALDVVLTRAMARRRDERFATAADFLAAIEAALAAPPGVPFELPAPAATRVTGSATTRRTASEPTGAFADAETMLAEGGAAATVRSTAGARGASTLAPPVRAAEAETRIGTDSSLDPGPPGDTGTTGSPATDARPRSMLLPLLAGAVLLVLAAGGGWWWSTGAGDTLAPPTAPASGETARTAPDTPAASAPAASTTQPAAAPAPVVAAGRIEFQTTPPGADVRSADGRLLGTTPVEFELPAGDHDIRVSKPGYHELDMSIEVRANVTAPLRAELQRQR